MQEKNTNYGKIIAITLAVISAGSAIAYVIYRLCRNFFKFCDSYREDEIAGCDACIKELSAIYEKLSREIPKDEKSRAALQRGFCYVGYSASSSIRP